MTRAYPKSLAGWADYLARQPLPGRGILAQQIGHHHVGMAGGVAQLIFIVWAGARDGLWLRLSWPRWSPQIKEFFVAFAAVTVGAASVVIAPFIDTILASYLPVGSRTALYYADRINQLPLGVLGIALGTVLLPEMSARLAKGDSSGSSAAQNRSASEPSDRAASKRTPPEAVTIRDKLCQSSAIASSTGIESSPRSACTRSRPASSSLSGALKTTFSTRSSPYFAESRSTRCSPIPVASMHARRTARKSSSLAIAAS